MLNEIETEIESLGRDLAQTFSEVSRDIASEPEALFALAFFLAVGAVGLGVSGFVAAKGKKMFVKDMFSLVGRTIWVVPVLFVALAMTAVVLPVVWDNDDVDHVPTIRESRQEWWVDQDKRSRDYRMVQVSPGYHQETQYLDGKPVADYELISENNNSVEQTGLQETFETEEVAETDTGNENVDVEATAVADEKQKSKKASKRHGWSLYLGDGAHMKLTENGLEVQLGEHQMTFHPDNEHWPAHLKNKSIKLPQQQIEALENLGDQIDQQVEQALAAAKVKVHNAKQQAAAAVANDRSMVSAVEHREIPALWWKADSNLSEAVGDNMYVVVSSTHYPKEFHSRDEVLSKTLHEKVHGLVMLDFEREYGDKGPWRLPVSTIEQLLVRDVHFESFSKQMGSAEFEMWQAHVLLDLSPEAYEQIVPIWRDQIVDRRMWMFGGLFAFATLIAGTSTGYLRLDHYSHGAYRKRLKFAAISIIVAGGLAMTAGLTLV